MIQKSIRPQIFAGIPAHNATVYRKMRLNVHDTAVVVELPKEGSYLILRDIEMERARRAGAIDHVHCPGDFAPPEGLSGDRDIANAQAAAQLLRSHGVNEVWSDRTLPLLYAHYLADAGVHVRCDPALGVMERRSKTEAEIEALREAQSATEEVMRLACELVASASAAATGELQHEGAPLTSERVMAFINMNLMDRAYAPCESIVAGGPAGADCHNRGSGPLRTGEPVIIDIFPRSDRTLYCGDCTRTIVHGGESAIPDRLAEMHAAVVEAKSAAIEVTRAGVTGEDVHAATARVLTGAGFKMGLPPEDVPADYISMPHGTGHGIGLDVHEPPLLDTGGPELVAGDALTIEPGLYGRSIGGVRVEDMVIVTDSGCMNLNSLPEGLTWK